MKTAKLNNLVKAIKSEIYEGKSTIVSPIVIAGWGGHGTADRQ
jgi:hypothetical protein